MPTVSYPLDTSGVNPTNLVTNEIHTVSEAQFRDYYFVVPNFAPFFVDNFRLVNLQNGVEVLLNEDVDYSFALPYITGTRVTGKQMYGAITLHNQNLDGILTLQYQTIGGDQICDRLHVLSYLADKAYNPRTTVWDIVTNVPNAFPPVPHYQDYDNFKGQEALVAVLGEIRDAIASNSSLTSAKIEEFLSLFTGTDLTAYVKKTGDTVTGQLILEATPSQSKSAISKSYAETTFLTIVGFNNTLANYYTSVQVDSALSGKLDKAGGTMTGPLLLSGVSNDPKSATDKEYVDGGLLALNTDIQNLASRVADIETNGATRAYIDSRLNEIMSYLQGRKAR